MDYRDFERQLRRIDQLLVLGGVEKSFVEQSLARFDKQFPAAPTKARQHNHPAIIATTSTGCEYRIVRSEFEFWQRVLPEGFAQRH